jgi:hypothetical protein
VLLCRLIVLLVIVTTLRDIILIFVNVFLKRCVMLCRPIVLFAMMTALRNIALIHSLSRKDLAQALRSEAAL